MSTICQPSNAINKPKTQNLNAKGTRDEMKWFVCDWTVWSLPAPLTSEVC